MQKHSDRIDKRAPINCGTGNGLSGLGSEYWSAALYGYGAGQLAGPPTDHPRLPDISEARDPGGYMDPRYTSAFAPLQPPVSGSHPSESASKSASVYDSQQFHKHNGQVIKIDITISVRNYFPTLTTYLFIICLPTTSYSYWANHIYENVRIWRVGLVWASLCHNSVTLEQKNITCQEQDLNQNKSDLAQNSCHQVDTGCKEQILNASKNILFFTYKSSLLSSMLCSVI